MKILDIYILKSYLKKFFSFFFLIMLVFIFQTIWMFIDDLAGKEIDFEIIFKFLIFYCPKLIPLVLPLTVLLASIMTFGDLAENYEFAAIKSSGISLFRSMKSLIIFLEKNREIVKMIKLQTFIWISQHQFKNSLKK